MYSTCIFCNSALGRNEALEHFPVGRRLAFDPAKGRLWAVCPQCERWNLTPLETRWEAIEEAEREYRGTRLRASTDNIGLARLREGLELVRVGAPLFPEFAAWRYGDQFGQRRRKHFVIVGAGIAAGVVVPFVPALIGAISVFSALQVANGSWQFARFIQSRRAEKRICVTVRDDAGHAIPLTADNIRCTALIRAANNGDGWHLALPYGQALTVDERFKDMNRRGIAASLSGQAQLTGAAAVRALGAIPPQLNIHGANQRNVREAVAVINSSSDAGQLLRETAARPRVKSFGIKEGETYLHGLPSPIRLALEMALHANDERRAMEGELRELEQRWRDAEAIANIADSLTLPPDIEERLSMLRNTSRESQGEP